MPPTAVTLPKPKATAELDYRDLPRYHVEEWPSSVTISYTSTRRIYAEGADGQALTKKIAAEMYAIARPRK
jgi:hypothetical protein